MDPMARRIFVHSHMAALEAEAAGERLARAARAAGATDAKPSVRAALGRGLISIGRVIAATPADETCREPGAANGA